MAWIETESLSFVARHEAEDTDCAQRTLDALEDLRLRLEERFDDVPGEITVIVHPTPGWLAAAHPFLPAARLAAAPAGRRYLAGWAMASELHVLNAWRAFGEGLRRPSRFARYQGEIAAHVRETRLHHLKELDAVLRHADISLPEGHVHLAKGDAGEVIPRFCKAQKVDLLVLGTVARTGLSASLIGNTAETLARTIECSILAVKPDGFVSPIRLEHTKKHSGGSPVVD